MSKRTNPGDVANLFIRCLLSDAGAQLGSFNKKDWENTLQFFDYKCAYTGEPLTDSSAVKDHLVSHNKISGGLNLYGNIIPCTARANAAKRNLTLEDFFNSNHEVLSHLSVDEKAVKMETIISFVKESKYEEKVSRLKDLTTYCHAQYEMIKKLCEINKDYIANSIGEPVMEDDDQFELVEEISLDSFPVGSTVSLSPENEIFGKVIEDTKIQDIAKEAFFFLIEKANYSDYHQNLLLKVQDLDYCRENLLLDYPAIKKVSNPTKAMEERIEKNYARYYATLYDNQYLLTSQWFNPETVNLTKKKQKDKLVSWVKNTLLVEATTVN